MWTFQRNWFLLKSRKRWNIFAAYLVFGILTGVFSLYFPHAVVLPIVAYIGIIGVSFYLYQGSFLSHAFAAFLLLIVGVASEAIVVAVYSVVLQIELAQIRENDLYLAIGMFISKMLCLLIIGIIVYYANKRKSSHLKTIWRIIPLLFCQLILIVIIVAVFFNAYQSYGILSNLDIVKIIGILFVSIFIYTYYDIMTRVEEFKYMNDLAKIQLDNHIKYYNHVREQEEVLISIEHDCRQFVAVLDNLIKAGYTEEAIEYKASFEKFIDKNINLAFSPHPVVSAIINNCIRRSKNLGVSGEYDIRIPKTLEISDVDLTIILGNVLENAIKALELVADNLEKVLKIKLIQNDNFLLFEVVNTCSPEEVTKKTKKKYQGYGLKNAETCVLKYSGEFFTKQEDNKFKTTAIMSVSAPKSSTE